VITSHQGVDLLGLAKADFNFSRIMNDYRAIDKVWDLAAPIPGHLRRDTESAPPLIKNKRLIRLV